MIECCNCKTLTQNKKYCSRKCAVTVNNAVSPKRKAAKPEPRRCLHCNSWTVRPKFCSQRCAGLSAPRASKPEHPCECCAAPTKNARFCSVQCTGVASRKSTAKARWSSATSDRKTMARREVVPAEQLEELRRKQNGLCGICQTRDATCVDHCHTTGKIRGWLCRGCNSALGTLGDDVEGVTRALKYLTCASGDQ